MIVWIELHLVYNPEKDLTILDSICVSNRVGLVKLYKCDPNSLILSNDEKVFTTRLNFQDELDCMITLEKFPINVRAFTEAYNYNLELNGKISIALNGDIMYNLFSSKVLGNIYDIKDVTLLISLVKEKAKLWFINKDNVANHF